MEGGWRGGHPTGHRDTTGTRDGTPTVHRRTRRTEGRTDGRRDGRTDGRRRNICLDFALATEGSFHSPNHAASPRPHALTNETKRFPGWGHSALAPPNLRSSRFLLTTLIKHSVVIVVRFHGQYTCLEHIYFMQCSHYSFCKSSQSSKASRCQRSVVVSVALALISLVRVVIVDESFVHQSFLFKMAHDRTSKIGNQLLPSLIVLDFSLWYSMKSLIDARHRPDPFSERFVVLR